MYNGLMCEWPKFVELDKIFEQTCCYKSQSECASCLLTGSVTTKGQLFFYIGNAMCPVGQSRGCARDYRAIPIILIVN